MLDTRYRDPVIVVRNEKEDLCVARHRRKIIRERLQKLGF